MPGEGLTGTRIRERRMINGLRQADLAREIGISASYLNLIEHNRRRIAGKLLIEIATVLGVETSALTQGAEASLLASLREAEAGVEKSQAELGRIEEFAGRFPGWAALVSSQHARIAELERNVDALGDRLTHDPVLAASVHEVLSTAASIRSTASILADTDELEREWLDRFHTNINEDSARLAQSSRALAAYLENEGEDAGTQGLPQEEVDALLERYDHYFYGLETGSDTPQDIVQREHLSELGAELASEVLTQYQNDAQHLPAERLLECVNQPDQELDPVSVARRLDAPVGLVMRRLACLPDIKSGYVLCDRSGSLLLRKGLAGFSLPRFGASCPLWPVFQAMGQPGSVIHHKITQLGRRQMEFDCFALAEPIGHPIYNLPPLIRSAMLILPTKPGQPQGDAPALKVGSSCRVCPRAHCPARREPSIVGVSTEQL